MHLIQRTAVILAALAATASLALGQGQQAAAPAPNKSLVGTWQVLRHGVDCDTRARLNVDFPTLMTFNLGGTLNGYAVGPGDTPATETPEYGNWTRDHGTYTLRDVSYGYDDSGTFAGRGEVTGTITLAADGNSFTADTTIDIFDANGNLLFSFCGMWTGTRFK